MRRRFNLFIVRFAFTAVVVTRHTDSWRRLSGSRLWFGPS